MNEHDKDKKWKQKIQRQAKHPDAQSHSYKRTKRKLTYLDNLEKDQKADIKRSQQTSKDGVRKYHRKPHKNENTVKMDPQWQTT